MSFRLDTYDPGPWELFVSSFLSGYLIRLKVSKSHGLDPDIRGFEGDVMVKRYASSDWGVPGMEVRLWDDDTSQTVGEPFFVPHDAIKYIGIY